MQRIKQTQLSNICISTIYTKALGYETLEQDITSGVVICHTLHGHDELNALDYHSATVNNYLPLFG